MLAARLRNLTTTLNTALLVTSWEVWPAEAKPAQSLKSSQIALKYERDLCFCWGLFEQPESNPLFESVYR